MCTNIPSSTQRAKRANAANARISLASVCKTLARQSKQTRAAIAEHKRAQNTRCELYRALWKQPWMLRTALAGSRASKQVEQSLVFKALAAAAAQALVVAAAWRALK